MGWRYTIATDEPHMLFRCDEEHAFEASMWSPVQDKWVWNSESFDYTTGEAPYRVVSEKEARLYIQSERKRLGKI